MSYSTSADETGPDSRQQPLACDAGLPFVYNFHAKVPRFCNTTSDATRMNKVFSVFSSTLSVFLTLAVVATGAAAIADTVGWRFEQNQNISNTQFPVSTSQSQALPEEIDRP